MSRDFDLAVTADRQPISFNISIANRHGLITGATGTGKTLTVQHMIEAFSNAGVPVFVPDVKGEMAGIAFPGGQNHKVAERFDLLKIKPVYQGFPVNLWDLQGKKGHHLQASLEEFGPILLGRVIDASDVQQGIINAVFRYAEDHDLLLFDLDDFRATMTWIKQQEHKITDRYGKMSESSIGAINRGLLLLEDNGGKLFFSDNQFGLENLLQQHDGKGVINILDATTLVNDELIYSSFLLWMLTDLLNHLPEVGDLEKPKMVFFFDEAHLLFSKSQTLLVEKIIQIVRLIRSKGVGVYFITQNPIDLPEKVLGQLGNRVQHALRGYTPSELKAIKAAAETFRTNPDIDTTKTISALGVGEALISLLNENGVPNMVEVGKIIPPMSRIGMVTQSERQEIMKRMPPVTMMNKKRLSAKEILSDKEKDEVNEQKQKRNTSRQTVTEAMIKSAARSASTQVGRAIVKGFLAILFGKGNQRK